MVYDVGPNRQSFMSRTTEKKNAKMKTKKKIEFDWRECEKNGE